MTRFNLFLIMIVSATLLSCGSKKSEAEKQREQWLLSLNDSIAGYQRQMAEVSEQLAVAQKEVGRLISDFSYVEHTREVEGYYILKGWESQYPLSTTGLIARITKSEGLEIIATLVGGSFNEIAVSAGGHTVSSGIVPHDQAFNYRTGQLNRVCFTSAKADSIGQFLAKAGSSDVSLIFLETKTVKAITLDKRQQKMVADTWQLYDSQTKAHRLEREMSRLSGKVAACRQILSRDSISDK